MKTDDDRISILTKLWPYEAKLIDLLRAREDNAPSRAAMCRRILTGQTDNLPPRKPLETEPRKPVKGAK